MITLVLVLAVVLPFAWFISEFQPNQLLRILLGVAAIALSFWIAGVVGKLDRMSSNTYFGTANKDLIQNTIDQLEKGNSDRVLEGLLALRSKYEPSYETRDDYHELVEQYVASISKEPITHEAGMSGWSHEQ